MLSVKVEVSYNPNLDPTKDLKAQQVDAADAVGLIFDECVTAGYLPKDALSIEQLGSVLDAIKNVIYTKLNDFKGTDGQS